MRRRMVSSGVAFMEKRLLIWGLIGLGEYGDGMCFEVCVLLYLLICCDRFPEW